MPTDSYTPSEMKQGVIVTLYKGGSKKKLIPIATERFPCAIEQNKKVTL